MKQFTVTTSMDSDADVLYTCLHKVVQECHSTLSVELFRNHLNQLELRWIDHVQPTTQTEKNWKYEIAQVISKFIVDHMEFFLLRKMLLRVGAAYEEHEINKIVQYCKQLLTDIEAGLGSEERTRQSEIATQIFQY